MDLINKSIIINPLEEYLGCPVILANQHSPAPKYPYVSFTITAPVHINQGSYGTEYDGLFYKPVRQTWSFTVQSDNDDQCNEITLKLYHWFSLVGVTYLSDNNISIERLENISNRDNLITIQYEYRRGFDVRLVVMDKIEHEFETIESVKINRIIKSDEVILPDGGLVVIGTDTLPDNLPIGTLWIHDGAVNIKTDSGFVEMQQTKDENLETETNDIATAINEIHYTVSNIKSDANYIHNQSVASDTWIINHNLNKYCDITIVDSAGTTVIGEIKYLNMNSAKVIFKYAFAGKAYCN